ncbi:aldose 1-epimerase [Halomonas sp. TRM85114]|uniref:aldose 1-epimerase n=1 Tax=Halomonas jincaotanensis TaxID=2810616 RepID=UPI001BD5B6D0|nr:aldose 1-epimerase [Halomonas jincaotanensis]MBS9403521.1 aldose 1-epimerase [Halomonas jincaotanensis]
MTITLENGVLRLLVNPDIGGSVVRFDALTEDGPLALMRPGTEQEYDPNRLAMYPLVPWSNRISAGGFEWGGNHYALDANHIDEPLPIHGDGWQRPWRVEAHTAHELRLVLRSRDQPPFDYRAELTYRLMGHGLEVSLTVTHLGESSVPYGLGVHPWFPRSADTRIIASADGVWEVDEEQLPRDWRQLVGRDLWDFSRGRPLPDGQIDNLFTGWNGQARLEWPERGVALEISTKPCMSRHLIFSPGKHADFFCFEPVSHEVDAHHFDSPSRHGLIELAPRQSTAMTCHFSYVSQDGVNHGHPQDRNAS